jgi:hypothetical protein
VVNQLSRLIAEANNTGLRLDVTQPSSTNDSDAIQVEAHFLVTGQ